jgi:endonuclease/exonuclease/phosphatase family metal-dependent hydrolase
MSTGVRAAAGAATSASVSAGVRALCYDVNGLRGDRQAMDAMVRELAPDVVIVQGAPRRVRWRTRCADMADRFGLVYAGGGEPSLGNVVLVSMRVSVREVRYVQYPLVPGQLFRGAILARCAVAGTPFVVAGSQFAAVPEERHTQAAILAAVLSDVDDLLVLGVDVNEEAGRPASRILADRRTVAGSAGGATMIVDPRVEIGECHVVDTPEARRASTHLPLLADLRLRRPTADQATMASG